MNATTSAREAAVAAAKARRRTHSFTVAVQTFCEMLMGGTLSAGVKGVLLNGAYTGVKAITDSMEAHKVIYAAAVMAVDAMSTKDTAAADKAMAAAIIADATIAIISPHGRNKSYMLETAKSFRLKNYNTETLRQTFPTLASLV